MYDIFHYTMASADINIEFSMSSDKFRTFKVYSIINIEIFGEIDSYRNVYILTICK